MGLYYVQINVMCIIALAIVLMSLNRTTVMPARRVAFNKLVFICIIICLSDIFAWYFNGKVFEGSEVLHHLSNMVYYLAITWEGYAWLGYVDLRIKKLEQNVTRRLMDAVPLAVMTAVVLVNPLTRFLFTFDENGLYSRGPGISVHWVISWFYLIYATVKIVMKIKEAQSRTEKEQLMPLLWFIVPPIVAAVFQMMFYGLTSTQCGLTLSIMIIAFRFLSDETSRDALTGLNNRKALETELLSQLSAKDVELTIMMCDIDNFKTINDTLGHAAGDLVLRHMAEALKNACEGFGKKVFLCRYGGDEFIICGDGLDDYDTQDLIGRIESSIRNITLEGTQGLDFSISVGSSRSECRNYKDVESLIGIADASMYESKRGKKISARIN